MPQNTEPVKYRDPYEDPEPLTAGPSCCERPQIQLCGTCLEHPVCANCDSGDPCFEDSLALPDYPVPCPECGNPNREDWRECAASGCVTIRGNDV